MYLSKCKIFGKAYLVMEKGKIFSQMLCNHVSSEFGSFAVQCIC